MQRYTASDHSSALDELAASDAESCWIRTNNKACVPNYRMSRTEIYRPNLMSLMWGALNRLILLLLKNSNKSVWGGRKSSLWLPTKKTISSR